jgi:hypothetical protein
MEESQQLHGFVSNLALHMVHFCFFFSLLVYLFLYHLKPYFY